MKNIVSCSLGKDSVAMLLLMLEKGIKIDEIVWANTSLEFPENFTYLKKLEDYIGRKITVVKPKSTFQSWFYRKFVKGKYKDTEMIHGFPFVVTAGWCCREFKEKPLDEAHKLFGDCIVNIGYTSDEPTRNMKNKKGITYKYPLREWNKSETFCRQYLEEKDLLNPLYYRFERVGCWLCPKQNKRSLRSLYLYYPNHWKLLKKYEKDSPHGFRLGENLTQLENLWKNNLTNYINSETEMK